MDFVPSRIRINSVTLYIDFPKVDYENGNFEEFVMIKLILKLWRHFVSGSYVTIFQPSQKTEN